MLSELIPWVLSGGSAAGLRARAARLLEHLAARPALAALDVGFTLAAVRAAEPYRAVVSGAGRDELLLGLAALAAGESASGVVTGRVAVALPAGVRRVAFVFPGQGTQWPGMACELARSSRVFAARLAECGRALEPYVDWSPSEMLATEADGPELERVDVVQPALWAVMVSLAALWESAGVVPDAVVGHSQGEIAAACVAGALSLEDGARVVARRSQALRRLSGAGGMLSIALPPGETRDLLGAWPGRLSIAAVNGPASTVVSGETAALAELEAACATGPQTRRVRVDYASHSPQVEGIRAQLLDELAPVSPRSGRVPVVSGMTGQAIAGPLLNAGYWYESLRHTVEFDRTVRGLTDAGYRVFVEVSPHPVLAAGISEILGQVVADTPGVVTGTLRRGKGGPRRFLASAARLHVHGAEVGWAAMFRGAGGRRVDLPVLPARLHGNPAAKTLAFHLL
jgi:acyl transferase domain-containing protein